MYLSLTKTIVAAILGAILVKENENASNAYDRVRKRALTIIRENILDKDMEVSVEGRHDVDT